MTFVPEQGGKRLLWGTGAAPDRDLLNAVSAALKMSARICSLAELPGLVRRGGGDIVGVELDPDRERGLAIIRQLHARVPGATIIAAAASADVDIMRAALASGACDVIALPLTDHDLHRALLRSTQLAARMPASAPTGQVITVYGARGGIGTTTLAVNLAVKLGAITEAETAIVDLDLQRGDVAAFLDVVPIHSLASIATAPGEVDEIFLAGTITRHPTRGVSILAAPNAIEEADLVTDREVELALRIMRSQFRFTIVDTPRAITAPMMTAVEHSDRVLLLTDLSVPSVRAARRTVELFGRMHVPLEHVELLITEAIAGPVELKKAVDVIGKPMFALIPRDDAASSAMNDGVPLNGKPTRIGTAIDDLAHRLSGVAKGSKSRGLLQRVFSKGARA